MDYQDEYRQEQGYLAAEAEELRKQEFAEIEPSSLETGE